MLIPSIDALNYLISSETDWSTISSFEACSDVAKATKSKRMDMIQGIAVSIYTVSELIYSLVILRLFVGNILKFTLFCQTLPIKESVKC